MTGPTWQCSDCDTYNDAAVRVCDLCEMPRREAAAPKAVPAPKGGEPRKTPAKKTPAKKTPTKKTPAKKTPAKKAPAKTTPAKKTALAGKEAFLPSGARPPTRTAPSRARPAMPGLDWECPVCLHDVVGRVTCDVCGTLWTRDTRTTLHGRPLPGSPTRTRPGDPVRPSSPLTGGPAFGDPLRPRPIPREPTRGEVAAGCGCILFIAAAVVTLIVMLVLNWSTVTSFLTGSDSSKGSATPSPTVSASGPCPKELAAMLPKGSVSGARLVAAYSRDNVKDRYAFCRTKAGKVYYFFAKEAGERYGRPTAAEKSGTGYLVRFPDSSFRFRDLEVTAYDKDDKELWKEKLTPEATVG